MRAHCNIERSSRPTPSAADIVQTGVLRLHGTSRQRPTPTMFTLPGLTARANWGGVSGLEAAGFSRLARAVSAIVDARELLLAEYDAVVAARPASDYVPGEHSLHEGTWDWHSFVDKGERRGAMAERAPKTAALLESVPRLMTGVPFGFAFFSSLRPDSQIAPHSSPMNLRLRVHVPLRLPPDGASGECSMGLAEDCLQWRLGEAIVFDDSFVHATWNRTDHDRVVLLFDVWHPELADDEVFAITSMFGRAREAQRERSESSGAQ